MFVRVAILAASLALSACDSSPSANNSAGAPAKPSARETAVAAAVADGPPTVDGVYAFEGCEGEGGCPNRHWRTVQSTPLLDAQITTARVIGTLAPGEWVSVEEVETRLVPKRGVVRDNTEDLRSGEVIYALGYEGEGFTTIWRRGALGNLEYDTKVDWEEKPAPPAVQATLGLWARVKRENGEAGWVHEPRFECMGKLAGDENCRD